MSKKLLTLVWYIFYTLIIFEIFARVAYAVPYTADRLFALDENFWYRRWVKNQKNNEHPGYYFDDFDPHTGWVSKPNIKNKHPWPGKFFNTNSKRLRGVREFSYEKSADKTRILVIGDSFTFGEEVSDNETYSHYLQERFSDAEVLNMGMHGYGHDQMLVLLKQEGLKYNPDIIVLGFLTEDMSRNLLAFRDFAKPKYIVKNDTLVLTNSPVPSPESIMKWNWARPRLLDLWTYTNFIIKEKNGQLKKDEKKITRYILQEFAQTSKSIGATPVFAYLPYGPETMSLEENSSGEQYLFEVCEKIGAQHCFTSRTHFIQKIKEGAKFRTEFHWFPPGHQAIAESIGDYLIDQNLIKDAITTDSIK